MDFSITASIASIHNEWLTAVSMLLDNSAVFALAIIAIALLIERERKGRVRLAATLILTFILASALKNTLAVSRPCATGGEFCPSSFSLPSMHASIAFALLFAFLDKKIFPLYLLFALFVAFTRLTLGVHTFEDVAAALPVAFISFYLSDEAARRWMK